MITKNKVLLLHIIESKGNVKQLIREGFNYKSISELLEVIVVEGLVVYDNKKIILTVEGKEYLKNGKEEIKKMNKDLWIDTENKSKIAVLGKKFIFLPNQNELHF